MGNYEIKRHLSHIVSENSVSVGDMRSWTKTPDNLRLEMWVRG